jgi:hypothetical protein
MTVLTQKPSVGPLSFLSLEGCGLSNDPLAVLAGMPHLATVRRLNLQQNKLSVEALCQFLTSANTAHLELLELSVLGWTIKNQKLLPLLKALSSFERTISELWVK